MPTEIKLPYEAWQRAMHARKAWQEGKSNGPRLRVKREISPGERESAEEYLESIEVDEERTKTMQILTIGYGNRPLAELVGILQRFKVKVLVDVRSRPYSRWRPEFNRPALMDAIELGEIEYVWMGKVLGGLHEWTEVQRLEGVLKVRKMCDKGVVAIMCSESEPPDCHRWQDLGARFEKAGLEVEHWSWKQRGFYVENGTLF